MLVIIVLIVSLAVGYAVYSTFSSGKAVTENTFSSGKAVTEKFKTSDEELSSAHVIDLSGSDEDADVCDLWANIGDEKFQITLDGKHAAHLVVDKSKPPRIEFYKFLTDPLHKIVVNHINKFCSSLKEEEADEDDGDADTTPKPRPRRKNDAPVTVNRQAAVLPAAPAAILPAAPAAVLPAAPAAVDRPAASAASADMPSRPTTKEGESSPEGDPSGENAADNKTEKPSDDGAAATGVQNDNEITSSINTYTIGKKLIQRHNLVGTNRQWKDSYKDPQINLDDDDQQICDAWKKINTDGFYYLTKQQGTIHALNTMNYQLKKSTSDEDFKELTKTMNDICSAAEQSDTPTMVTAQQGPETDGADQAPPAQSKPAQSPAAQSPAAQSPAAQSPAAQSPAAQQSSSYVTAPTPEQRTQQETQFMDGRNDKFLAILKDGKLEMKNFKNDEKNMFIDELNTILADIKIKFEQRLGIEIKDNKSVDLNELNKLGFVKLAHDDEEFKVFFEKSFISTLSNLKVKISEAKEEKAKVEKVLGCFEWLQKILFGVEEGNPSLAHKVEEALRVRHLDLHATVDPSADQIVSEYDKHRMQTPSTEISERGNRVIYFGSGQDENSANRLIFDDNSVLYKLVDERQNKEDPIRVQIIEHYGELVGNDCFKGEKRSDPEDPLINTFSYGVQNLNAIRNDAMGLINHKTSIINDFVSVKELKKFVNEIKKNREKLKSRSKKKRVRRFIVSGQSRSHLIVHLYKPGQDGVPYATIMDIAKASPKDAEEHAQDEDEDVEKKWREKFFKKGQYKDLSGVIKKVRKAFEFIQDKNNLNIAQSLLKTQKINHLYKNENGDYVDLIHGGTISYYGNSDDEDDGSEEDLDAQSDEGPPRPALVRELDENNNPVHDENGNPVLKEENLEGLGTAKEFEQGAKAAGIISDSGEAVAALDEAGTTESDSVTVSNHPPPPHPDPANDNMWQLIGLVDKQKGQIEELSGKMEKLQITNNISSRENLELLQYLTTLTETLGAAENDLASAKADAEEAKVAKTTEAAAAEAKLREAEEAKAAAEAKLREAEAKLRKAEEAKAAAEAGKDASEAKLSAAEAARDTAEAAKNAAEAAKVAAEAKLREAIAAKDAAEAGKDTSEAKLSAAEAARDTAEAAKNAAEAAKVAAEAKLSAASAARDTAEAAKKDADAAKDAAEDKLSAAEAKLRETERKLLEAKEAANAEVKAKLSEAQDQLDEARAARAAAESQLQEVEGKKRDLDKQVKEKETLIQNNEDRIQNLENQLKDDAAMNDDKKIELQNEIDKLELDLSQATQAFNQLTASNEQYAEESRIATEKHQKATSHIQQNKAVIAQLMNGIQSYAAKTDQLKKENEILRGNTGGFVLQESSALKRYDELINFGQNDVTVIEIETFINNTEADQLWLLGDNDKYKMFKDDESNFQLIEFNELSLEISKFRLKPYPYPDPHYVIFRAYLYNKLIRKLNDFLKNQDLEQLQFETIVKFDWTSVEGQLSSIGSQPISKFESTDFFKSWKKPEAKKFNDEDKKFLKFLEQPKNRREKMQIVKGDKKIAYQDLRKLFIDEVFCPVFHSAQYIKRTYPTITSFVEFIDKNDKKGNINFKSEDVIDKAIMKDMKIGPDDQNSTTVVHVKFKNGTDFRPKPTTGGKKSRVPKFMKFDDPMSGGSRYVNFKLSSRSIERMQNVSYYNIVKTIRWRYYLSRKKTEEPVEVTVFKDYLFTLIACVFLLAAGNDKLAYGTFVDQLLSIGLLYEFDQDFTALLLPYYLPFT